MTIIIEHTDACGVGTDLDLKPDLDPELKPRLMIDTSAIHQLIFLFPSLNSFLLYHFVRW